MAKPPDCGNCKKPATIHLTQIVNNQIKKLDFCEDCPHQKGMGSPEGFSLGDLLAQTEQSLLEGVGGAVKLAQLSCSHCGMTPVQFKKTGRFGCAHCYVDLMPMVEPMLTSMHKGTRHIGKVPRGMMDRVALKRRLGDLREQLKGAIAEERFEDAAKLRDDIELLRKQGLAGELASGAGKEIS